MLFDGNALDYLVSTFLYCQRASGACLLNLFALYTTYTYNKDCKDPTSEGKEVKIVQYLFTCPTFQKDSEIYEKSRSMLEFSLWAVSVCNTIQLCLIMDKRDLTRLKPIFS